MRYKGRAEQVAKSILEAFEAGQVPKALATVFIHRKIDSPCRTWSWRNRLLIAMRGHFDARGYRQWQEVDRQVIKGERACHILAPWTVKAKEDDPDKGRDKGDPILIGFLAIPVFGHRQTEGQPLPWEEEEREFLDGLPLVEVARHWGVELTTYDAGPGAERLGFFRYPKTDESQPWVIGLGVENAATWAHELVHAADRRLDTLSLGSGQKLDNEVVAELGGAVMLECLGLERESDRGGAWAYVRHYAEEHDQDPLTVCNGLLERTCACVSLILDTAEELAAQPEAVAC